MITGYFGQATAAGVRNFQQSVGLPMTGAVDAQTRSAIQSRSCGGNYSYNNVYPTNTYPAYTYPTNTYPTYPTNTYPYNYNNTYPYNYNYNTTLTLTSLSANTGIPGSSVTIYGQGFDVNSNTVYLGTSAIANVSSSYNGTSITFTIPTYANAGAMQVYVVNTRGTSNSLQFTVLTSPYTCGTYNTTSCGGCGYGYSTGYNCDPSNTSAPSITYLNPNSGAVGSSVSIFGSGFTTNNNTVRFGNGIITNLGSLDGRGLTFTVPSTLTGYGTQQVTLGSYSVYVTNGLGINSNTVSFNVNSLAGSGIAPTISSVNGPNSLAVGVQGTWTITVSAPSGSYLTTSVRWGDENLYGGVTAVPQTTYMSGSQTLTFTHTYQSVGTFTPVFTVSGAGGTNTSTATVTVTNSTSNNALQLTSLSQMSGRVGTQITLFGSGFTGDNMVHFGVGGVRSVTSASNTSISFTIPSYISPCDLIAFSSGSCGSPAQQVVLGSYPIYVTNTNGATSVLYFTVTN